MNTEPNNKPETDSPFGEVVYAYTRSQAVADGVQVEVTKTAKEAGISIPVFLTRTVFDAYVAVPPNVSGQDEAGRLWDIVWMLRFAISRARGHTDRVPVALYVRNDNQRAKLVKLIATCGPLDMDDASPAITLPVAQFRLGSPSVDFRLGSVAAGSRHGSVRVWRNFSTAATE